MDRLIDPVIADMQCEHEQATRKGQRWRRRWTLLEGYFAFWRVLAVHVPVVWTSRIMREWVHVLLRFLMHILSTRIHSRRASEKSAS